MVGGHGKMSMEDKLFIPLITNHMHPDRGYFIFIHLIFCSVFFPLLGYFQLGKHTIDIK